MADRDITVDVTIRSDTKGAKSGAAALGDVDKAAEGAGKSMKKMEVDSKALTAQIDKSKTVIKDLEAELTKVGNNPGIRKALRVERSWLAELEKVGKSVAADAKDAGSQVGKAFVGGMSSALESTGPLMLVLIPGITAAVAEILPGLGAMIGGGISGAVGTGAMAAGLLSASHDPRVMAAAHVFGGNISDTFFSGEAFVKPAMDAMKILEVGFKNMHLDAALAKVAPTVTVIAEGLSSLGNNIMPGLNKTLDRMGPFANVAAEGMGNLGTELGGFLDNVSKSPGAVEGLKMAFVILNGTIGMTGDVIHWLEDVFDGFLHKQVQIYNVLSGAAAGLNHPEVAVFAATVRDSFQAILDNAPPTGTAIDGVSQATTSFGESALYAAMKAGNLSTAWDVLHGKTLSADEAMAAAKQAVKDVGDAFASGGKSIQGNSDAALDNRIKLELAGRAAAAAATEYYNAHVAIDGQASATAGANKIMEDQRVASEKAAGATGKNKDEVHKLADELFKLPNFIPVDIAVTTTYKVSGSQVSKVENQLARFEPRAKAAGGPVEAGVPYMINERGFETVTFPAGGQVHPANLTPMMASGGGGATYNVNVYAAPLTSPVDTGAAVVQALRQYEMANGSGWRA